MEKYYSYYKLVTFPFHSIPRFWLITHSYFFLFIDFLKEKKVGNYVLFYSSILYYGYESKSLKGAHSIQESRANRFPGNDSLFLALNFFPLSLSLNKNSIILGRIIKNVETKQNNIHHTMLPHPSSTITNVA